MELSHKTISGEVTCLQLAGNLDIAGVLAVETRVLAYCGGDKPRVLIDLSETRFIASLGIRLLLQAIKTAVARGGSLLLWNPTATAGSVLEISGLGTHVFCGTEVEAHKKLTS